MPTAKLTPLTIAGWERVTEPQEAAFTVLVPQGWTHQVSLQREQALNRAIVVTISPEQRAMVHLGDPRIPMFFPPTPFFDPHAFGYNPLVAVQPYTPAEAFFVDYAHRFFGKAPSFRIVHVGPAPTIADVTNRDLQRAGRQAQVTAAAVRFQYQHGGQQWQCQIAGPTVNAGVAWYADPVLVSTTTNLDAVHEQGLRMWLSRHFDPRWMAAQQRLHEMRMAQGQQQLQFINQMTELQNQGHQQRMQDIQNWGAANTQMHNTRMAQMDEQHAAYMNQQASSDRQQQAWFATQASDDRQQQARVNAIREEHTVQDASGSTYQVDIHHDRYFVNPRDNTYIGSSATTELNDLARMYGVNPADFVEVKVVR